MKDEQPTGNRTQGEEQRSEKVNRLLGEIPPGPVRWGSAVIAIIFLAIIATICLLPYPYSEGEPIFRHILSGGVSRG